MPFVGALSDSETFDGTRSVPAAFRFPYFGSVGTRAARSPPEQLLQSLFRLVFLFREIDGTPPLLRVLRLLDELPQRFADDLVEIGESPSRRLLDELLDLLLVPVELGGQSLGLCFEQVLQPARLLGQFLVELVGQVLPLAFQLLRQRGIQTAGDLLAQV